MSVSEWRGLLDRTWQVWAELHVSKCRMDVMPARGGSSAGAPAPMRFGAADVQERIRGVLVEIATAYARDYRVRRVVDRDIRGLLDMVRQSVLWVDKHEGSAQWYARLRALVDEGWSVVDRPADLACLGVCGLPVGDPAETCETQVWCEQGDKRVQCPGCAGWHDVQEVRDRKLMRASAARMPLSQAVLIVRASGLSITEVQARHWTKRKDGAGKPRLKSVGTNGAGVKLYRIGDVIAAKGRARKYERAVS
ncbi:hypothetical protein NQ036_06860 [Brevibacterium sp. 91QC2O2]|uniref:hypothetical protein n=1 Tax=Brevibacterium sp. 91QC2O2 TaxID=2968458 RepID=UPI00211C1F54|nr:hypothetical protein [Brevibacterium sp. 91QC2O2]MCQ9367964.1 hypothetical protein [Brevibacterium sp. 91QC2O2]